MVTYRNRSGGGGDDSGHAMHGGLGKRARRGTGGRASRLGKERERERERACARNIELAAEKLLQVVQKS